jgi:hypothetical protein
MALGKTSYLGAKRAEYSEHWFNKPTQPHRSETPLFAMPFTYKMHHFAKTGSGQT